MKIWVGTAQRLDLRMYDTLAYRSLWRVRFSMVETRATASDFSMTRLEII
jgi:hypothetical protein